MKSLCIQQKGQMRATILGVDSAEHLHLECCLWAMERLDNELDAR